MGLRNAQELPWWPSGRELGPQKCPKRGLGSVLATNFAPKGVPIGAWGAFFKRQGGVLGLRNAQELLWWPSGRELGPQECPRTGLGSVFLNVREASWGQERLKSHPESL